MEFELDRHRFRVKKLNAINQLHLTRKISPLLPALTPIFMEASKKLGKLAANEDLKEGKLTNIPIDLLSMDVLDVLSLAQPFADALAGMPDQDAEQVFSMTLASVQVLTSTQQDVWMPLWNASAKMTCMDELDDAGKLLPIVIRVIVFNLRNFMDGLVTNRAEASPASNGAPSLVAKTG